MVRLPQKTDPSVYPLTIHKHHSMHYVLPST